MADPEQHQHGKALSKVLQQQSTFTQVVDGNPATLSGIAAGFGSAPFDATYSGDADANQARNFLRDAMNVGDLAFFYHSGCADPGVAGVCEVCSAPYPDATQFSPTLETALAAAHGAKPADSTVNRYFDPKSKIENPRWWLRDVHFVEKRRYIPLTELRIHPELANMRLLARGNRLSIMPVTADEWAFINRLMADHS
jgi:predicted RNA-binding protein with PUA-like domain